MLTFANLLFLNFATLVHWYYFQFFFSIILTRSTNIAVFFCILQYLVFYGFIGKHGKVAVLYLKLNTVQFRSNDDYQEQSVGGDG